MKIDSLLRELSSVRTNTTTLGNLVRNDEREREDQVRELEKNDKKYGSLSKEQIQGEGNRLVEGVVNLLNII